MAFLTEAIVSSPIASLSLLSLLIPILIHLFNPNRGKIILIGNLHLIRKVKNKKVTEVKIRQWILLVTRLIFLIVLTLLLMRLLFPTEFSTHPKHSVFITNGWLEQASQQEKGALLKKHAGQTIYRMQPGFKQTNDFEINKPQPLESYSLDSLISEAYLKQLLTSENHIYFNQDVDFLSENRKSLLLPEHSEISIEWNTLEESRLATPFSLIKIFYSADRVADLKSLQLAFKSIFQTNNNLSVSYHLIPDKLDNQLLTSSNNELHSESQSNFYFWLSSESVPTALMQEIERGSLLLTDLNLSDINGKQKHLAIGDLEFDIYHQLPTSSDINSNAIWSSGTDILLSYQPIGQGRLLQFNTRFNPNWNNLNKGTVLLGILKELLELALKDPKLQVSDAELININTPYKGESKANPISHNAYRNVLILILVVIWLIERVFSESRIYSHD